MVVVWLLLLLHRQERRIQSNQLWDGDGTLKGGGRQKDSTLRGGASQKDSTLRGGASQKDWHEEWNQCKECC